MGINFIGDRATGGVPGRGRRKRLPPEFAARAAVEEGVMNPLAPLIEYFAPNPPGAAVEKAFMQAAVEGCPVDGGKNVDPEVAELVFKLPPKVRVLKSTSAFVMESKSLGRLSTNSNGSFLNGGRAGLDFEVSGNVLKCTAK